MNKNNKPALFGALALAVAAPASAALYRCGNVFQDRPCEGELREILRDGGKAPALTPPASAPTHEAAPSPAHEPASAPAREEAPVAHAAGSASLAASAPVRRKGTPSLACGNLREQYRAIEARMKTATRPETTEMYERQRRGVERGLEEGNC